MLQNRKRVLSALLAFSVITAQTVQVAQAAVAYMPHVTAPMSEASFWADYYEGYRMSS